MRRKCNKIYKHIQKISIFNFQSKYLFFQHNFYRGEAYKIKNHYLTKNRKKYKYNLDINLINKLNK